VQRFGYAVVQLHRFGDLRVPSGIPLQLPEVIGSAAGAQAAGGIERLLPNRCGLARVAG
jgi:hypothetical protein